MQVAEGHLCDAGRGRDAMKGWKGMPCMQATEMSCREGLSCRDGMKSCTVVRKMDTMQEGRRMSYSEGGDVMWGKRVEVYMAACIPVIRSVIYQSL